MPWESTRPSDTREDYESARKRVRPSTLHRTDEVDAYGYVWRGEKCIGKISLDQYLCMTLVERYATLSTGELKWTRSEHLPSFDLVKI